jgi:Zn-dependent protease
MQTDVMMQVFTIAALIISIILHEVAHGYAAYALGDPTAKLSGRLTLNPLPHIDPIGSILIPALAVLSGTGVMFGWAKPVPYNPYNLKNQRWGEALVGIAGVATNIALAILFAVAARIAFAENALEFASFAAVISYLNLFLGLFNLIPFPPLDGFTVIRGLLPYKYAVPLRGIEARLGGFVGLIFFLILFSYVLAGPFSMLVEWVFGFLIGA